MDQYIWVNIMQMAIKKAMVKYYGLMVAYMRVNLRIIFIMELED
jgi:hypothetical protein